MNKIGITKVKNIIQEVVLIQIPIDFHFITYMIKKIENKFT